MKHLSANEVRSLAARLANGKRLNPSSPRWKPKNDIPSHIQKQLERLRDS